MHEIHRRVGPTSLLIWSAALLSISTGGLQASPDKVTIETRFQHAAPSFSAFRTEHWDAIAEAAESLLVERGALEFGFLDWSSSPGADDKPLWILSLEEQEQTLTLESGPVKISRVLMNHFQEIEGQRYELHQTGDREILYDWGAILPAQSPDLLEEAVLDHLDLQLDALLKGQEIREILAAIPLTDTMIADGENRRFVLPLRLQELQAKPDSVLSVIFVVQETDTGRIKLEPADIVTDEGPHKDFVRARIRDFVFRDVAVDLETDPWWQLPIAEAVLQAPDVKIYMIEYKRSLTSIPTTTEGLALEPGV